MSTCAPSGRLLRAATWKLRAIITEIVVSELTLVPLAAIYCRCLCPMFGNSYCSSRAHDIRNRTLCHALLQSSIHLNHRLRDIIKPETTASTSGKRGELGIQKCIPNVARVNASLGEAVRERVDAAQERDCRTQHRDCLLVQSPSHNP